MAAQWSLAPPWTTRGSRPRRGYPTASFATALGSRSNQIRAQDARSKRAKAV
ncbi:hypothetical protein [Rhodospirillum sp. A1_3_36]|uniref:hypothetical protein n=1 Tax=Rhodospirillum sp. A1_3_36 TaxID=3391666 RepID=UPI0039A77D1B